MFRITKKTIAGTKQMILIQKGDGVNDAESEDGSRILSKPHFSPLKMASILENQIDSDHRIST